MFPGLHLWLNFLCLAYLEHNEKINWEIFY